jgi:hypothetical protein
MIKPEITILTNKVPIGADMIGEYIFRILRLLKNVVFLKINRILLKYGGHFAVTRSLVEGLRKNNIAFTYNPLRKKDLADVVHVVGGVRPLRQMINFKKKGFIKKLYAGPNIATFSNEYDSLLASPEIDSVVNHSDFACNVWAEDHPELIKKCFKWACGVDSTYWVPNHLKKSNYILIFDKRMKGNDPARTVIYVEYLISIGYLVKILTRTENLTYTKSQYLDLLQGCEFMIGFTVGSESQGVAWAEAWSCNVPTLILRNELITIKSRTFKCSTAPFLTNQTGLFFDNFEDFKIKVEIFLKNRDAFNPRSWVLKNMTDEVCAKNIYMNLFKK